MKSKRFTKINLLMNQFWRGYNLGRKENINLKLINLYNVIYDKLKKEWKKVK